FYLDIKMRRTVVKQLARRTKYLGKTAIFYGCPSPDEVGNMLRVVFLSVALGAVLGLTACASSVKTAEAKKEPSPFWTKEGARAPAKALKGKGEMQVFYGDPKVPYKKVCKIEAEGNNAVEQKYTKKADFESQFKRRA